MTIEAYLEAVKERCVTDPLVIQFSVARERSTVMDGYLRARLALADANQELSARWDNTPHFPDLPGFPDHIHDGETGEVTPGHPMSIFTVLNEIARRS